MSTATERISWFPVPDEAELSPDLQGLCSAARERIGFVPTVVRSLRLPARAALGLVHPLPVGDGGPARPVGGEAGDDRGRRLDGQRLPLLPRRARRRAARDLGRSGAGRITLDWRRADGLTERQRAICAPAEKLTRNPLECAESDLDALRAHGLSDEDACPTAFSQKAPVPVTRP
jgi:hypothetical protein